MGPNSQSKDPCQPGVFDRGTLVIIMQILPLVSEKKGLHARLDGIESLS